METTEKQELTQLEEELRQLLEDDDHCAEEEWLIRDLICSENIHLVEECRPMVERMGANDPENILGQASLFLAEQIRKYDPNTGPFENYFRAGVRKHITRYKESVDHSSGIQLPTEIAALMPSVRAVVMRFFMERKCFPQASDLKAYDPFMEIVKRSASGTKAIRSLADRLIDGWIARRGVRSFDEPIGEDSEDPLLLSDTLEDPRQNLSRVEFMADLRSFANGLQKRDRMVLAMSLMGQKPPLIAKKLDVSAQSVRNWLAEIHTKYRKFMDQ